MTREILIFVEDTFHRAFLEALLQRLAASFRLPIHLELRNSVGGYGKVISELKGFVSNWRLERESFPDLLVVATDANCHGLNERKNAVIKAVPNELSTVCAIPDPHIERWMLLDSKAFKTVFGRGCDAPDQKCDKGRYKMLLAQAMVTAGVTPLLGGAEYAADIAAAMDLDHAAQLDPSFQHFLRDLRAVLVGWSQ
jgi:hypothetical protein